MTFSDKTNLDESDSSALLTEALTADVEAVLADQTSGVGADTAVRERKKNQGWKSGVGSDDCFFVALSL